MFDIEISRPGRKFLTAPRLFFIIDDTLSVMSKYMCDVYGNTFVSIFTITAAVHRLHIEYQIYEIVNIGSKFSP